MKKLLSILSIMTLSVMLFAQAPQSFSYQTVIRDASWNVLSNQSVGIKISILEDVANGTVVYEETHSATTSQIGLVNLSVGDGVVMTGVFNTIDWGNHNYFIEVAVDVTGGTTYIVMGTTQLRSVPYALYAETSGTPGTPGIDGADGVDGTNGTNGVDGNDGVDGTNGIDGTNGTNGAIGTFTGGTTIGEILFWNGSNWLALNPPANNNMFLTYNTTSSAPEWVGTSANIVIPPVAAFTASLVDFPPITLGIADTIVEGGSIIFQDNSTNYLSTWLWDFGNGSTSTNSFEQITYNTSGTYVVTMIVSNNAGSDTAQQTIVVLAALLGCTDSTAFNYNTLANTDDGSCIVIGNTYEGGIIFWLDGNGGGLIAATGNQLGGEEWGCYGTLISGADGTAIGTGAQNTIDIEAGCTASGISADICANYTDGTYSDWFLPSKDELNEIKVNLHQQGFGSFNNDYYWSSTEKDINDAWMQSFSDGTQTFWDKLSPLFIIAVRAF